MENLITLNWRDLLPEGILVASAALVIVLTAFSKSERSGKFISFLAMLAFIVALVAEMYNPWASGKVVPTISSPFGIFSISCAVLSSLMGFMYFSKGARARNEFFALLMVCSAALTLFVNADNLMFAFVALECATVCLYTMSAWSRKTPSSLEAAAKYLVISGVSGAILLLGIAFIYGGGLSIGRDLLLIENFTLGLDNTLFNIGLLFVVSGLLFKLAAFPFQFWAPDVYQGAPTPLSAFFAVASKGAGIVFLVKICLALDFEISGMEKLQSQAVFAISVISALTIIVGNLGGITQVKVKRLTAFSGISNAGYLLVLVAAALSLRDDIGFLSLTLYFYLAAYLLANYGIFFVMNQFENMDDANQSIADYRGLLKEKPVLGSSLIMGLASLSGIPPTAGFFGKLLILILAWYAQLYCLMTIMIVGSAISIYYYFAWIRMSIDTVENSSESGHELIDSPALYPTIIALSLATLFLGVYLQGII